MGLLDEYSFVKGTLLFNNKLYDCICLCSALRNTLYVRSCKSSRLSVCPGLFRVTEFGLLVISKTNSHVSRLGNQIRTAVICADDDSGDSPITRCRIKRAHQLHSLLCLCRHLLGSDLLEVMLKTLILTIYGAGFDYVVVILQIPRKGQSGSG